MSGEATRALLVDPFRDEREMYAHYLRMKGFDVTECEHPARAVDLAVEKNVAAVVTRVMLNGPIDGLALTRQLKSDDRTRHIPIVVISTRIEPAIRAKAEKAGCDAFLLLPSAPDVLAAELHRLTSRSSTADS